MNHRQFKFDATVKFSTSTVSSADERKLFLAATRPLNQEKAHPANDQQFPTFLRHSLESILLEVGFATDDWLQISKVFAGKLIQALRDCDGFPFDDVIGELGHEFDRSEDNLETMQRSYDKLLDSMLVSAEKFPQNFAFHEWAKELLFILKSFAQKNDKPIHFWNRQVGTHQISVKNEFE